MVSESRATYLGSESMQVRIQSFASSVSCIPLACSSVITVASSCPEIYSRKLRVELSQVGFASGLKASMEGLIIGKNLPSSNLPEYSVTEFTFV